MKNILVTSKAGYIGKHATNLLINKEYNATNFKSN